MAPVSGIITSFPICAIVDLLMYVFCSSSDSDALDYVGFDQQRPENTLCGVDFCYGTLV